MTRPNPGSSPTLRPETGVAFAHIGQLHAWLLARGISTRGWGMAAAKSVQNLWREIQVGESVLFDNPPLRRLHVTQVVIWRGDQILLEAAQEFKRGGRRPRFRLPSEKMQPGESYAEATYRCLHEEMGVGSERIEIQHNSYRRTEESGPTHSYPGLRSHWTFHRVAVAVAGLPATDFVTQEIESNEHDPILRHFWVWRPLSATN